MHEDVTDGDADEPYDALDDDSAADVMTPEIVHAGEFAVDASRASATDAGEFAARTVEAYVTTASDVADMTGTVTLADLADSDVGETTQRES